jgi:hypothetical protein
MKEDAAVAEPHIEPVAAALQLWPEDAVLTVVATTRALVERNGEAIACLARILETEQVLEEARLGALLAQLRIAPARIACRYCTECSLCLVCDPGTAIEGFHTCRYKLYGKRGKGDAA